MILLIQNNVEANLSIAYFMVYETESNWIILVDAFKCIQYSVASKNPWYSFINLSIFCFCSIICQGKYWEFSIISCSWLPYVSRLADDDITKVVYSCSSGPGYFGKFSVFMGEESRFQTWLMDWLGLRKRITLCSFYNATGFLSFRNDV